MSVKTLKKKKPRVNLTYITPDNIGYHKLSTIIDSTIEDVKAVVAAGFNIDMDTWIDKPEAGAVNSECSVCLGGATLLGWMKPPPNSKEILMGEGDPYYPDIVNVDKTMCSIVGKEHVEKVRELSYLMDSFRNGDGEDVASKWAEICKTGLTNVDESIIAALVEDTDICYSGVLSKDDIKHLLVDLKSFADGLRKYNL